MENNFQRHVAEWRDMNQMGRFAEARQYYFEQLFEEVIDNFIKRNGILFPDGSNIDVLFSVLGFTPEPIILAARALNPKRHIIFHDSGVKFNEDNMRYLSRFLNNGFEKIELPDESFATIYDIFKSKMALTAGRNYAINVSGGKKSMVAAASIFARDFNFSVIYVDYKDYDANLRRPIPGTEYLNVVYTPLRDLPELFHIGINNNSEDDQLKEAGETSSIVKEKTATSKLPLESEFQNDEEHKSVTEYSLEDRPLEQEYKAEQSLTDLLKNSNWTALKDYLNRNLHDSNIPKIQGEITEALSSFTSPNKYWDAVNELLSYDSVIFLGAVVKANAIKISTLGKDIDSQVLDSIITHSFESSSKLKFALDLLMPCKALLSKEQKVFIMDKCVGLPSSDLFYALFKLTGVNPSVSIIYLLNINSTAAAFTLYKVLADGQRNGMLREDSAIESLRPSEVAKLCAQMQASESYAFRIAALLIKNRVLLKGRVDRILINEIEQNGFEGFHSYIMKKEQALKSERIVSSLSTGSVLTKLRFIKSLDNHYLFVDSESQSYALLDKRMTKKAPATDVLYQAFVIDLRKWNDKKVCFVSFDEEHMNLPYTPLVNIGTIIDVNFSQGKDGKWYLVKNNYCKLLTIKIVSRPKLFDYRKKQQAKILQQIDFFTYKVAIL